MHPRAKILGPLLATSLAFATGCDRETPEAPTAAAPASAPAATAPAGPRVVFLGDSLTAGYGVESSQAWPALLDARLRDAGVAATVVNAGVSGDTTAGGLRRLDWVLRGKPDVVVVCLGGNDGLRHVDLASIESNLRAIVARCKAAGADVLLLPMLLPTNYGPEYRKGFGELYARVAAEEKVTLGPFALEHVGGVPSLNQADGIHPTVAGHRIVADTVFEPVRAMVESRGDIHR